MAPRRKISSTGPDTANEQEAQKPSGGAGRDQELVRTLVWNILSINSHMEDIRYFWAGVLQITGPQWLIVMAVHDLDRGNGVPVREVSAILNAP